ncbi:MAG: 23S rRNA (adenine(2503)-C(2))-methyltransferase RlmN [Elusimicrobiota bacterium]|nr:23S rRNA (adenine(2503)-C(2))-methyltransferase RlmN [Elusimicrobiota bacterium]
MDAAKVQAALAELGQPKYRWDQVRQAVFGRSVSDYAAVPGLPPGLAAGLQEKAPLLSVVPRSVSVSSDGRAHKALLDLKDGRVVETVLLRPSETRWTTCISSQVGCAVACTFCATGLMGLTRNLTPEEITDQVLFWRQYMARQGLPGRVDNVVYMGMGEPFACYEQVAESLRALMDQKLFAIGARHIAVSTSGVAPKMVRFGKDFPQVNLALSLHAATDELRARLVPMNKAYDLAALAAALKEYLADTNRKVFFEYVLLKGENDRAQDADALVRWLDGLGHKALLHVNLIVFNQTDTPHQPTDEGDARRFQERLLASGYKSTVRQNLGRDIDGACGQLVIKGAS